MRMLVTRPEEDSAALAERLSGLGHGVMREPMLVIRRRLGIALDLTGVQAMLLTSANGPHALAEATERRDLPVFAVGNATAAAARQAGFADIECAEGDAADLAALVRVRLDPACGTLLHAAGAVVKGTLKELLAEAGFEVRREVLYDARPAEALSPATAKALRAGKVDAVLFFSPRSARTFVSLLRKDGLEAACREAVAFCLSAAVADAAADVPWGDLRVADRPDQESLMQAICEGAARDRRSGCGPGQGANQEPRNGSTS